MLSGAIASLKGHASPQGPFQLGLSDCPYCRAFSSFVEAALRNKGYSLPEEEE